MPSPFPCSPVYGEIKEKLNRIDVRPASNEKGYLKWASKPS